MINRDGLKERIRDSHKVLDVGGWHAPLNRANSVIDFMPYETRNKKGACLTDVWPEERFSSQTYHSFDICFPKPWPFPDKHFDFAFCAHTLEDLRDPIWVCSEINRIAKAGYIEVPSRLAESTKGVERPYYCGYYHHRWLCEVEGTKITFQFKPAMLHAYRRFHFRLPWFKKIKSELGSVGFYWQGSFDFKEKIIIDRDEVQKDLLDFKDRVGELGNLWVPKYDWWGRRC